jgi:hypothetical protein
LAESSDCDEVSKPIFTDWREGSGGSMSGSRDGTSSSNSSGVKGVGKEVDEEDGDFRLGFLGINDSTKYESDFFCRQS